MNNNDMMGLARVYLSLIDAKEEANKKINMLMDEIDNALKVHAKELQDCVGSNIRERIIPIQGPDQGERR